MIQAKSLAEPRTLKEPEPPYFQYFLSNNTMLPPVVPNPLPWMRLLVASFVFFTFYPGP